MECKELHFEHEDRCAVRNDVKAIIVVADLVEHMERQRAVCIVCCAAKEAPLSLVTSLF